MRNLQILRTNSTDRWDEILTKGREGVQNPKIFADVLYGWSPMADTDTAAKTRRIDASQKSAAKDDAAPFISPARRWALKWMFETRRRGNCTIITIVVCPYESCYRARLKGGPLVA